LLGDSQVPFDIKNLQQRIQEGWTPKYLLFWGHRPKHGNIVGKHVLSQWWPCEFEVDGVRYHSAEHFMMAEKARLFGDEETRQRICNAASAGAAKALGREVKNFDQTRWDAECFEIVVRGNTAKFGQNESLRQFLLETGDQVLVEASPVDHIWGVGLAADDAGITDPTQWQGSNLLGFALMKVRQILRAQHS
jgi:ribA/ribD-fused uncharacterized protein